MNCESSFNLVDEPWIRVRYQSNETQELSLLELFRQADNVASLANDLPTQDFALLRLLLAVLQRSIVDTLDGDENPTAVWEKLWAEGLPIADIEAYLRKWHHRFNLFDERFPFMQIAGMHTSKNDVSPVTKIVADVPDGNLFFSMRSQEGIEELTYAEAARWLVHTHAFDTAGIKSGVVGDPSVKGGKSYSTGYPAWAGCIGGVYFEDKSLAKTLLTNLILWDSQASPDELLSFEDTPVWEREPLAFGSSQREPLGFADVYTWQSRRLLLHASDGVVKAIVLTNGDGLIPHNRQGQENMTVWKRSINQEKKYGESPIYLPMTHKSERLFWRNLSSVLPLTVASEKDILAPGLVDWIGHLKDCRIISRDYSLHLHAVGMEYGTQNSVITELIDDSLSLNAFLMGSEGRAANTLVRDILERTDRAIYALGRFAENLGVASGSDNRDKTARNIAQASAYYEIDALFRAWLAHLTSNTNLREAELSWNKEARSILKRQADEMMHQLNPEAIVGHAYKERGGNTGWMSASKAESIFRYKIDELLPFELFEKEGEE